MKKFSLENREFSVNRQTIHMDQGITYSPEYIESRRIIDYPSRRAQIIRAIWKNELQADEKIAQGIFRPMLTGQGERWQNFYEDDAADEYADVLVLGREMLLGQGFMKEVPEKMHAAMAAYQGHILDVPSVKGNWKNEGLLAGENKVLLIDDATAVYAADKAGEFLNALAAKGYQFASVDCTYLGYDHFANGLVDEARQILSAVLVDLQAKGIKEVLVTSGQSYYALTKLAEKLELDHELAVKLIWGEFAPFTNYQGAYVYGGSMNLRFLQLPLSEWFPMAEEKERKDTPEFFRLLEGSERLNVLNRWQPPVAAEFEVFGVNQVETDKIFAASWAQVLKAEAKQMIFVDPSAYVKAKSKELSAEVKWIGELIQ